MKIVFFGSSDFSLPSLEFCLTPPQELLAVVTTPDRPKGRGLEVQPNPVKKRADELGFLTFTPERLKDPELIQKIRLLEPDFFVVASYGKLIPDTWLEIPKIAPWNVHPSLLPRHRGAAPIPWQILEGDKETGVSIALVTKDLDAGDIVHQLRVPLEGKETTGSLTTSLAELARKALNQAFQKWGEKSLKLTPQEHAKATYARKLAKEDGRLDLKEEAVTLDRKIRAFHPWPGTFIHYKGEPLRILEGGVDSIACAEAGPGTLLEINPEGFLRVQAGKGSLKISRVQLPGRKVVSGAEFANGQRLKPGFAFEVSP